MACKWVEVPSGVTAQIMGHKPSATAEKHYRQRPVDLLTPFLVAELKLREASARYGLDVDEVLNWYRHHMEYISSMDADTVDAQVRDYAANRPDYRCNRYGPITLRLYKIHPGDPGYVRWVLLTDDAKEAQRRLTAIYGRSVLDMHRKADGQKGQP